MSQMITDLRRRTGFLSSLVVHLLIPLPLLSRRQLILGAILKRRPNRPQSPPQLQLHNPSLCPTSMTRQYAEWTTATRDGMYAVLNILVPGYEWLRVAGGGDERCPSRRRIQVDCAGSTLTKFPSSQHLMPHPVLFGSTPRQRSGLIRRRAHGCSRVYSTICTSSY